MGLLACDLWEENGNALSQQARKREGGDAAKMDAGGRVVEPRTDWRNVYVREPSASEWLRGESPMAQFGRMCERLGMGIVACASGKIGGWRFTTEGRS